MGRKITAIATVLLGATGLTPLARNFLQAYVWDWIIRMSNEQLGSLQLDLLWPYLVPIALVAIGFYLLIWPRTPKFKMVFDRVYKNEIVVVDGKAFHNCTFSNVTFEYRGAPCSFVNATIIGERRFETPVPEIGRSIGLLKFLTLLGNQQFANDWKTLSDEHFKR